MVLGEDREQRTERHYPSIERRWLKYYSEEAKNASLPECTIYEYLYNNNKDFPRDIAILYFSRKITYKELFENIDRCANALLSLGVQAGEIVTIALPSIPEALYLVYALNKIGAVANMIHPLAGEKETVHYLNEVNSRIFFLFDGTYRIMKDAIRQTNVSKAIVISAGESLPNGLKQLYFLRSGNAKTENGIFFGWKWFISKGKGITASEFRKDADTAAIISHTGGTTGEPKGVMCSDKNANALMHQIVCNFTYNRQGTSLAVLPPFVNYSLIEAMMAMLAIGYKVVLIPDYKPLMLGKYIKKYRPNIVLSIPAYWEAILKIQDISQIDMSCFEQIYAGGEAISRENEEAVNKVLLSCGSKTPLLKGLGSTEMTGGATQTYVDCNIPGSVGIPLVKLSCKIVSLDNNEELDYYEEGEICFSGDTVMMGYYNNEPATKEIIKIHSDGRRWLHTGDLGYIDQNGVIFVTGRIKRIIMTKGTDKQVTKMFPDRIEKTILKHTAVETCCVIGISDIERIHYAKAFIVLEKRSVQSDRLAEEIFSLCRKELPDYMIPEEIEFIDELPRTERGKIDYRALEEMANA